MKDLFKVKIIQEKLLKWEFSNWRINTSQNVNSSIAYKMISTVKDKRMRNFNAISMNKATKLPAYSNKEIVLQNSYKKWRSTLKKDWDKAKNDASWEQPRWTVFVSKLNWFKTKQVFGNNACKTSKMRSASPTTAPKNSAHSTWKKNKQTKNSNSYWIMLIAKWKVLKMKSSTRINFIISC